MSEQQLEACEAEGKTERKSSGSSWEKVGRVSVDAGLLWLGDPCYILDERCGQERPRDLGKGWNEFCERLFDRQAEGVAQWNHGDQEDGFLGVTVSTGFGDGFYDVFVKRTDSQFGRRIAEVKVVFMGEEDEEVAS